MSQLSNSIINQLTLSCSVILDSPTRAEDLDYRCDMNYIAQRQPIIKREILYLKYYSGLAPLIDSR